MNNEQLSIGSSIPSMLATNSSVSIQLYQNHREKVLGGLSYEFSRKLEIATTAVSACGRDM
jgi:hypothetical protein